MPTHDSCKKRLANKKKREMPEITLWKMTIRSLSKKMQSEIPVEEKEKLIAEIYSQLDKAAKRNIIHKRTASRRKARIAAYFNKIKTEKAV